MVTPSINVLDAVSVGRGQTGSVELTPPAAGMIGLKAD